MPAKKRKSFRTGSKPDYRTLHRMRSDQQAHTQREEDFVPVLDHPMVPANPPRLIDQQTDLLALLAELTQAGCFGFDTEFIGETSFYPRFCVIQVATDRQVTLIDALADLDLTPFWELVANPQVRKLVHAGAQDLEPVLRYVQRPPANVIDVQVAAGFAGLRYPLSLGGLVDALLGTPLQPGAKFSQWDRRPLSWVQMRYAADDVRYLPLLWQTLQTRLTEVGNLDWAIEHCVSLCEPEQFQSASGNQRLRARGLETLSRRKRHLLNCLANWRTQVAQQQDVPPRALIADGVLVTLARLMPQDLETVSNIRGLPRPIKLYQAEALLEVIQSALSEPLPAMPKALGQPSEQEKAAIAAAYAALEQACTDRGIAPGLVASKKMLGRLVRQTSSTSDMETARLLVGWRGHLLRPILEANGLMGSDH